MCKFHMAFLSELTRSFPVVCGSIMVHVEQPHAQAGSRRLRRGRECAGGVCCPNDGVVSVPLAFDRTQQYMSRFLASGFFSTTFFAIFLFLCEPFVLYSSHSLLSVFYTPLPIQLCASSTTLDSRSSSCQIPPPKKNSWYRRRLPISPPSRSTRPAKWSVPTPAPGTPPL